MAEMYINLKSTFAIRSSQETQELILSDSSSKDSENLSLNVYENFNAVVQKQERFNKEIISFVESNLDNDNSKEKITELLKSIDSGSTSLAEQLRLQTEYESHLLYILELSRSQIINFDTLYKTEMELVNGKTCKDTRS